MSSSSSRVVRFLYCCLIFSTLLTVTRADLVWTREKGWYVEGPSALTALGIVGEEGRNALASMNQARNDEQAGRTSRAMKAYERVAKKYPNSIYAPEALYRAGIIREGRKQYYKAFTNFKAVTTSYPNTTHFNELIGREYRIASALLEGARNRYFGIIPGFKNRARGIEYFEQVIGTAPYSDYAPLALMNVARGHQKLGNTDDSIDALDRMINSYPKSLLTPDAYLKLAQAHASLVAGPAYDQASTREAITYFQDFMILYPGDKAVATAETDLTASKSVLSESKIKIGDFYFYKRRNYKAARVFYNEAITDFPDSKVAIKARARLAEVEARENRATSPSAPPKPVDGRRRFWIF